MHLAIQHPDRITKRGADTSGCVRRQPNRCRHVSRRNGRHVDAKLVDISTGGISFMMTEEAARFKSGDTIELTVAVPAFGEVRALATVRSVVHLMDLTRIGVEFSSLPEDALRGIMEYVAGRERQIDTELFTED